MLTDLLPDDGSVRPADYKWTGTLLWALGRSDSPEVERQLASWRQLNERHGGHLAAEAERAMNAVRDRIRAKAM